MTHYRQVRALFKPQLTLICTVVRTLRSLPEGKGKVGDGSRVAASTRSLPLLCLSGRRTGGLRYCRSRPRRPLESVTAVRDQISRKAPYAHHFTDTSSTLNVVVSDTSVVARNCIRTVW